MTQVNHPSFGIGTVVSQDSSNVTVDFNGTVKTLVIAFSKLTKLDGTTFGVAFEAKPKKVKTVKKVNPHYVNRMSNPEWEVIIKNQQNLPSSLR
jgi:hypothetical protein